MKALNKNDLKKITPSQALDLLKEGNQRFVNNLKINRNLLQQVSETTEGQYPYAAIVSCMDSRTSTEHIFDQGIGDIFSIRNAGNIINSDVLGSLEYACKVAGAKLILIMGHTHCGAIAGAYNGVVLGNLTGLLHKIHPVIKKVDQRDSQPDEYDEYDEHIDIIAHENVMHGIDEVLERSHVLKELIDSGEVGICGCIYDVKTGIVNFFDEIIDKCGNTKEAV